MGGGDSRAGKERGKPWVSMVPANMSTEHGADCAARRRNSNYFVFTKYSHDQGQLCNNLKYRQKSNKSQVNKK